MMLVGILSGGDCYLLFVHGLLAGIDSKVY
ncbi:hypothetical protein MEE_01138 [Bartonella elizabethae F9251 = ATCC 49927]|uniref:Uncharacterized protein n=1 Tax=Bartonella elizabethae F9251 = ATCC 49927 TaxID=1094555 RepID=J1A188_BAREL|nr:hypothetical protein MEE_01138 [Bartonella elizabethae F9251 = ATCC 49927]VEJ41684.1 Uncharacterised protein [Bartonella elizabethae]